MLSVYLAALSDGAERIYFQKLYARYKTMVYQIARSVLRDPSMTEDAVQESWMRAAMSFFRIMELEKEKDVKGYLSILTKNVCVDMNGRRPAEEPLPEEWDAPGPPMHIDVLERVTELIRGMPEQYREILERKYILGYTNREIARAMGLNESTVGSRAMRGRILLADILRKEGFDESGLDI